MSCMHLAPLHKLFSPFCSHHWLQQLFQTGSQKYHLPKVWTHINVLCSFLGVWWQQRLWGLFRWAKLPRWATLPDAIIRGLANIEWWNGREFGLEGGKSQLVSLGENLLVDICLPVDMNLLVDMCLPICFLPNIKQKHTVYFWMNIPACLGRVVYSLFPHPALKVLGHNFVRQGLVEHWCYGALRLFCLHFNGRST